MVIAGIEVQINRKKIKNMYVYVKPPNGAVLVSAPLNMSDDAIERFVRSKAGWIKVQQTKFARQLPQTERQYVSGETLYLWGKQYLLNVDFSNKNSIELSDNIVKLTVRQDSTVKQREKFVREWYRELLKIEITRLLPEYENLTGLKCKSWQTKYMTSRWGTCNTAERKIWFNLQLAKKPVECLEYIILHELIHLRIKNHGADFIVLMDKYMPLWREVKKKLRSSE